jgi:outer membrane scaffolding protein for murein synthesis (MipA/OmpV family)
MRSAIGIGPLWGLLCGLALPAAAQTAPADTGATPPVVEAPTAQQPLLAAPGRPAGAAPGWSVMIGVAPVVSPAWQGSRDMAVSLFPDLRIAYADLFFASVPEGVGLNLLRRDGWRAGPLVKIRFGRDEDGSGSPFQLTGGSDALRGLGGVKVAGEAGGFLERRFGPREAWRTRMELRRGFGGHDGTIADVSIARAGRTGRAIWTLGPRATFASAGFTRPYFGIDGAQSLRTGLSRYRPDGGLVSIGIGGNMVRPLGPASAITIFGGIDQLGDTPGRSPLIRERGRRTQATIGLGYGYRFTL